MYYSQVDSKFNVVNLVISWISKTLTCPYGSWRH